MISRMKKYYDEEDGQVTTLSRTKRNEELYQDISESEIENINIESNAHVIGNNKNMDIDKIKELLEKKYQVEPKRAKLADTIVQDDNSYEVEVTKEYNINSLLNQAKKDLPEDYERERVKKVHDTQYDILKNLDFDKEEKKDDLADLIDTINQNELTQSAEPLDILSDLKGSENTVVLKGIKEELAQKDSDEEEEEKENLKKNIDKSFYTNSMSFTQSDFDDFNDLKEDVESNKMLIKVLLVVVVLAIIAGIIFLANNIFNLNWF